MTAYEPEGATGRPGGRDRRGTRGADAGYDAVVLAGGAARRLGGEDKPGVRVGGRTLLDRVLAACADATRTVVVAGPRPTARPVEWAREDPPGGGPLAALDAGLRHTAAPYVLVLSADLPFLEEKTVRRLLDTLRTAGPSELPPLPEGPDPTCAGPGTHAEGPDTRDEAADARAKGPGSRSEAPGTLPERPGSRSEAAGSLPERPGSRPKAPGTRPERPGIRPERPGTRPGAPDRPGLGRAAHFDGSGIPDQGPGTRAEKPGIRRAGQGTSVDDAGIRFDGVLLVDPEGRDQPLVAAYRAAALRRELGVLAAEHGSLAGLPLRRLVAALDLTRIADPVASFDCDTWDDIAAARARIREHGHVLDEWISAVKDELGIDLDVDTGVLLDLARDAAHGVARPAAPLTTFLVGYAAARAGGGPEAVADASRKAAALALRWADEDAPEAAPDAASPGSTTATTATEPDAG